MSKRNIVVVNHGWVFAGDTEEKDGRIILTNAVWVFRWERIGFNGVITNPERADLRPIADVDVPLASEVFRVPVPDDWGLED